MKRTKRTMMWRGALALPGARVLLMGVPAMLMATGLAACGASPITVRAQLAPTDYASIACPDTHAKFYLETVEDKRGYADPNNIGFTQTGVFNTKTSLLSQPPPAAALQEMLSAVLKNCGNLVTQPDAAAFLLKPSLLSLQISERTGAVSERISATVKYEALVFNPTTKQRVGRPSASGDASVSSMIDTTDYAAQVLRDALRDSVLDFARQLRPYQ